MPLPFSLGNTLICFLAATLKHIATIPNGKPAIIKPTNEHTSDATAAGFVFVSPVTSSLLFSFV